MTNTKKRNLILSACGVLLASSLIAVGATNTTVASAQSANPLVMDAGASVRISADWKDSGMRYSMSISETEYTALVGEGEVTVGMVIAPSTYVDEAHAFTEANLFEDGACYYWTADNVVSGMGTNPEKNPVLGNTLAAQSAHIWHVTPNKTVSESTVTFTGSIVNFAESSAELTREYVCRGYIAVTDEEGTTTYTLADYNGEKQENNTRSMVYVAQLACEDTSGKVTEEQKQTLKKGYIETVAKAEIATTYTVNHHKVVGSETVTETETLEGFVGEDVDGFAREYDGYFFNEEHALSKTSGSVYPDGKLVLNYYYEKAGIHFADGIDQVKGVAGGVTTAYSSAESALEISVAGNGDVNVTPNGTVEYTEVHVWVKNTTDKRIAFYVDWKTTTSAIGDSVTGGNIDGGYVIPANSGWVELIYTATGMTCTQFNIIALDGAPTTGAFYVSKLEFSNVKETPSAALLDFTKNVDQVAGATPALTCSHSTAENALEISVADSGDVNVTPNGTVEYTEVHVWVKNTTDKRIAFYVDWKTTTSAIGDSVTGGNVDAGYVIPANSGWVELIYTATGMTCTQFNIIALDGAPTTGAFYVSKVELK